VASAMVTASQVRVGDSNSVLSTFRGSVPVQYTSGVYDLLLLSFSPSFFYSNSTCFL
jgi:hypothetical protein